MLDLVLRRLARGVLIAQAVGTTGAVQAVRPAALAAFVRDALRLPLGPHLAVLFHGHARPDDEALVEYETAEAAPRRFTWGELNATINRLANALIARGVTAGGRVGIMLPNSSEYLIAQAALARIGATAVQIGYRLKPPEIAYILGNAAPRATIVHGLYLETMQAARAQAQHGGPLLVVGPGSDDEAWDRALAAASPEVPRRTGKGDDAGVIVYTSGTTGKSKGAHRSYRQTGLESVADMIRQVGVRADDRHLVVCPLYHSAAPAFVALLTGLGATMVLLNHFDAAGALRVIERERVTCSLMVPTMIVRITNLPPEVRAAADTSSLRWVMSVAAPLSTEAARRFMAAFGPVLWNFYGATETGIVTLAGPGDHVTRPGTVGRALRGNEIRLLDDAGHEVREGEIGELYARNEMLISGYHGNAAATRDSQRDGFFSVGDLARRDGDGYYYLESRKHDMVISGGVNIYPREIEDHLLTHPAILDVAVVGVPDPEWGESLRAFVVLRDGLTANEAEIIDYCRTGLADFKRPRQVRFVRELPRNPTGKVLKRELREQP